MIDKPEHSSVEAARDPASVPLRSVRLGSREIDVERRDGNIYLRLREPLEKFPRRVTDRLVYWAAEAPNRCFLAQQREDGSWHEMTFAEVLRRVRSMGQWLLDAGLSAERPLMLLSENELGHALLGLAALHVGVPFVPVSPSYSQLSDLKRLRYLTDLISPGGVYANDSDRYARALEGFPETTCRINGASLQALYDTVPTDAVESAHERVHGDTLGKIMFTSGSTGHPKGVMFPHRMLCSNYQQVAQAMAFVQDAPPVMVDWLPWHHTFGGTHNLGIALYNGGTFYIDPGRPTPDGIGPTVELLRRVAPTLYFNTPQGYQALLPHLRGNRALRENFFSRLQLLFYGAARMPEHLWAALDDLSVQVLGKRVLITSGIGSTEAGPSPNFTPWDPGRSPTVGAPVAGITIKVAPVDGKLEMRLQGPCVTPGYWLDPERTAAAFDEEGFFCTGDAVVFVDPVRPESGLRFDGRLADNFKLASGTWVDVASLRGQLIEAAAPYLRDVVITGHDEAFIGALLFPDYEAARLLDPALPADTDAQTIVENSLVRAYFQRVLDQLASATPASSQHILRASLEAEPPLLVTGELSDKNAINQRAVLEKRHETVEVLHATTLTASLLEARK